DNVESTNSVRVDTNANANANAEGTNVANASQTNQFGSNTNLNPVSRPGATNRFFGTNRFGTNMNGTNSITGTNGFGPQDIALTEFDRTLIIRMRTTIIHRLGGTPAAWSLVRFNSKIRV